MTDNFIGRIQIKKSVHIDKETHTVGLFLEFGIYTFFKSTFKIRDRYSFQNTPTGTITRLCLLPEKYQMNKWNNRDEKTGRHNRDHVCKIGDDNDVKGEIGNDAEMLMRVKLMSFCKHMPP